MKKSFFLKKLLMEKEVLSLDINAPERLKVHRAILHRKPMIRNVFIEFHHEFMKLDRQFFGETRGLRVELGAGVCPIRNSYPEVLATDIEQSPIMDQVLDAHNMDLQPESVRAIYGQNCFHHFSHPSAFFSELVRVLTPGGGAILIEPYYGPVAGLIYKHLFASEGFDKLAPVWVTNTEGPMGLANQALSYIVFMRDRKLFDQKFSQLEIVYSKPLTNYLRYFLSGGLNFRALVPRIMEAPLMGIEFLLSPLAWILALHHVIILRRKS
jgi:SAM-dependent methyltransferase